MFTWLHTLLLLSFLFFSPSLHTPWTRSINSAVPCVGMARFGLNTTVLTPLANLFLLMPVELEHLLLASIKKSTTIALGEPWAARALFHRWVFSVGVRTALHWAEGVAELCTAGSLMLGDLQTRWGRTVSSEIWGQECHWSAARLSHIVPI